MWTFEKKTYTKNLNPVFILIILSWNHSTFPEASISYSTCTIPLRFLPLIHILPFLLHLPFLSVYRLDQECAARLTPQPSFSSLLPGSTSTLKTLKPMSLALILRPPQRPEFQPLPEHLPFQFWECPMLYLHQIFEQTIFSGLEHSLSLTPSLSPN